ncbi:MAG: hypothetical protein L6U16_13390 [Porphyromonadaceae bacterium]|nr:MAG: hypothetical protein L6U16_13390 [Porphyromonadaceae bacterium]
METKSKQERIVPYMATHPGEVLQAELQERGIKQKEFLCPNWYATNTFERIDTRKAKYQSKCGYALRKSIGNFG